MIEGAPDRLVARAERIAERTADVDEHVALWIARRPEGAARVVRLLEERAPPSCYRTLLPSMLQDPEARVFASSRAIRRGVDGVNQWTIVPHEPGVSGAALFDALGDGQAPFDVVVHVAAELVGAFTSFDDVQYGVGADNFEGRPSWPQPRSTLLVRPFDLRHVHFAFNGDVTLDVVTDKVQLERPAFEIARRELAREANAWRPVAHQLIARVVERLQNGESDGTASLFVARHALYDRVLNQGQGDEATRHLLSDSRIPNGRKELKEMLRALFPQEHARARDLDESARAAP